MRAVNATLEPAEIADIIVDHATQWVPARDWALLSSDLSGQMSVLSGRGVTDENEPAMRAVGNWVMQHEIGRAHV